MKVLMINVVCGIRSTGRICTDLATELEKQGHEVKIAYGREQVPEQFKKYAVKIGTDFDVKLHALKARLFDTAGFESKSVTKKFIEWVKEYDPDVIHLHNLHGYYINVELLFDYLKKCQKKIIWTLHDCWSFTGHCVYFDYVECERWKRGCHDCPQKKEYPICVGLEQSKKNYWKKRMCFRNIDDLTLVTPSMWLAQRVEKSYMSNYPVEVINNGVDTNVFHPIKSNVRNKYNLGNKKIILGVASVWDKRKGLETFLKLSQKIKSEYQIVLVGLSRQQISKLPKNIKGIKQTNSPQELAALYSIAEVFVNPTLEDNYPTTNIEAIACGTPVITYNTGGSPESAKHYGLIIEKRDIDGIIKGIEKVKNITRDLSKDMDYRQTVNQYMRIYKA